MFEKINHLVSAIKQSQPLILNITNDVTMDFIANGLLSLGASPVMSKSIHDVTELIKLASCITINIGTLTDEFIYLCETTCRIANQLNKPIILDPVGVGATKYRTETALTLLTRYKIAIVRGNASEIMALTHGDNITKGVDSCEQSENAIESAKLLSSMHQTTIVVSGKTDFILEGDRMNQFTRGSNIMPMITGSGCLLSAIVAAFHAVEKEKFIAASAASLFYSVCGEIAARKAKGPGSFRVNFLDMLHVLPEREHYESESALCFDNRGY